MPPQLRPLSKVVAPLVELLCDGDADAKASAARGLAAIASKSNYCARNVGRLFVDLLKHGNDEGRSRAAQGDRGARRHRRGASSKRATRLERTTEGWRLRSANRRSAQSTLTIRDLHGVWTAFVETGPSPLARLPPALPRRRERPRRRRHGRAGQPRLRLRGFKQLYRAARRRYSRAACRSPFARDGRRKQENSTTIRPRDGRSRKRNTNGSCREPSD